MAHEKNRVNLGLQIRRYRIAAGKSQKELAEDLGVTQMSLSHWENNRNAPSINSLIDICNSLGITANDLLDAGTSENRLSAKELAVVNGYRQVPEFQKAIDHLAGI